MAWVLAGLIGHLGPGQVTIKNGIVSGAFIWFGFVMTTMLVNNSFGRRDRRLLLIDGGHWLMVLVVIGAIIGAFGVVDSGHPSKIRQRNNRCERSSR